MDLKPDWGKGYSRKVDHFAWHFLIVCLTRLCTKFLQAAAHIALGQVFAAVLTCQAGLRVEPGCCVLRALQRS